MKVCYLIPSTGKIVWDTAWAVEGVGDDAKLRFNDGGWNPASDCFFTEAQCRRHHRLPPKDWQAVNLKVAEQLEKMAEKIRGRP